MQQVLRGIETLCWTAIKLILILVVWSVSRGDFESDSEFKWYIGTISTFIGALVHRIAYNLVCMLARDEYDTWESV